MGGGLRDIKDSRSLEGDAHRECWDGAAREKAGNPEGGEGRARNDFTVRILYL